MPHCAAQGMHGGALEFEPTVGRGETEGWRGTQGAASARPRSVHRDSGIFVPRDATLLCTTWHVTVMHRFGPIRARVGFDARGAGMREGWSLVWLQARAPASRHWEWQGNASVEETRVGTYNTGVRLFISSSNSRLASEATHFKKTFVVHRLLQSGDDPAGLL